LLGGRRICDGYAYCTLDADTAMPRIIQQIAAFVYVLEHPFSEAVVLLTEGDDVLVCWLSLVDEADNF